MRIVHLLLIITVLLMPIPISAIDYEFTTLDYPGALNTGARGINLRGEVVGYYEVGPTFDDVHGFLLSRDTFRTIDYPGDTSDNRAFGINSHGLIVGSFGQEGLHGYIYHHGAFRQIDYPGAFGTTIRGVNLFGDFVGEYDDLAGNRHGFANWSGVFSSIDFPGADTTSARAINDRGVIVGYFVTPNGTRGYVLDADGFHLISYPGASLTRLGGINKRGQIVGMYEDATGLHGFLLEDGVFHPIEVPGSSITLPVAINNKGEIAGEFSDAVGRHGFIARPVR